MFFAFKDAFDYANGSMNDVEFIVAMREVIDEARRQLTAAVANCPIGSMFETLQDILQAADMGNPYTMGQIRDLIGEPLARLNAFTNE